MTEEKTVEEKTVLKLHKESPYIELDIRRVRYNYAMYRLHMRELSIYYAVKANPHECVLEALANLGSKFDAASLEEIKLLLSLGIKAHKISYGNTIKKSKHIAKAYDLGIRLFAIDSLNELEKVAQHAPGSSIYCRLLSNNNSAQWSLGKKFGCSSDLAVYLLEKAHNLGLVARGVSFHVGSQQLNLSAWDKAISQASDIFKMMDRRGIRLNLLNLGGGFPIKYCRDVPTLKEISRYLKNAINSRFGSRSSEIEIMIEPGRAIVADAGIMCAEVVLVANKSKNASDVPWLYLDVGRFNGLAETQGEAIRYKMFVPNRNGAPRRFIIAGPTCDSVDIIYEQTPYELPSDVQHGDKVYILGTGAYTSSYASVCFNGFLPIQTYIIDKPKPVIRKYVGVYV